MIKIVYIGFCDDWYVKATSWRKADERPSRACYFSFFMFSLKHLRMLKYIFEEHHRCRAWNQNIFEWNFIVTSC